MKKLLFCILTISAMLFSCQKEDNLINNKLLLSKEIFGGSVYSYKYNNENKLIKIEMAYDGNFNGSADFTYLDDNKTIYIDFTQQDSSINRDSIKYFFDEGYSIGWHGLFGMNIFYFDSQDRISISTNYQYEYIENGIFFYSSAPSDSVVYNYQNNNTQTSTHFAGTDEIGTVTSTYDNRKNPYKVMPHTGFYELGNILKSEVYVEDSSYYWYFDYSDFVKIYEYNTEGYPIKEIRSYKGGFEPQIRYFEYIKAK